MRRGVQARRGLGGVGKAALELLLGARFRFGLMLGERGAETVDVDGEAVFAGKLHRELDGEAECVEEMERGNAVDNAVREIVLDSLEFLCALTEGALELLFLGVELGGYASAVIFKLGIDGAVGLDHRLRNAGKAHLGHAELHRVAERAADYAAQDIALIHVGGGDAAGIAQHEGRRPHVVGDYAEGLFVLRAVVIALAGKLRNAGEYAGESVGVVYGGNALERRDGALQAHAGVDVLLRERLVAAVRGLVVLHENVVPDLEILAAVAAGEAVGAAGRLARVDEHFGIGTAGAGLSGGAPPVMLASKVIDMGRIRAHLDPAVVRLGIAGQALLAGEAGEVKLAGIYSEPFLAGKELPAPGDGFLLEIIAE